MRSHLPALILLLLLPLGQSLKAQQLPPKVAADLQRKEWRIASKSESERLIENQMERIKHPTVAEQMTQKLIFDQWNEYCALAVKLFPDAGNAESSLAIRAAEIQKKETAAKNPVMATIFSGIYCINEAAKELGIKPSDGKTSTNEELQTLKNKLAEVQRERDEARDAAEWNYQVIERRDNEITRLKSEVLKGNATISQLAARQPVYIYRDVPSTSSGTDALSQFNDAANQRALSDLQRQMRDYNMRPSWRR